MSLTWDGPPEESEQPKESAPKPASYCKDCDGWDDPTCTHGRYQGPYFTFERGFGGTGSNPF